MRLFQLLHPGDARVDGFRCFGSRPITRGVQWYVYRILHLGGFEPFDQWNIAQDVIWSVRQPLQ